MGILVRPLPMENGCEALNISKELLLRGYAGRHTDSGAAWKKRVSVGTNCNFELILLPAGVGTGGVPKTKTTFGFGRVTLPEGARCDRGRIRERTKLNLQVFRLLSRKQRIGESLEQFHGVLSGLAARCSFGTLDSRVLRDVFIVNMTSREAQNQL